MFAADMLGSYGSTKRYKDVQRIFRVNDSCVVAASGEISDFQHIQVRKRFRASRVLSHLFKNVVFSYVTDLICPEADESTRGPSAPSCRSCLMLSRLRTTAWTTGTP